MQEDTRRKHVEAHNGWGRGRWLGGVTAGRTECNQSGVVLQTSRIIAAASVRADQGQMDTSPSPQHLVS